LNSLQISRHGTPVPGYHPFYRTGITLETRRFSKKICLLGDPAVGKTSLIHRYVYDMFDDKYLSTIGAKITKKSLPIEIPEEDVKVDMTLLVWDIAGQKMFGNVHQTYYKGAAAALVVADITRRETFDNIVNWISEFFKVARSVPVLVLTNKYDLKDKAEITEEEINNLVEKLGVSNLFTSARTGLNVERAFSAISDNLARRAIREK